MSNPRFYLIYFVPEELMRLIDTVGLYILLDIVHSHACKNMLDGLICLMVPIIVTSMKEKKGIMISRTAICLIIAIGNIRTGFSNDYHEYFDDSVDKESVMYLILIARN
ncbi:1,4-alpha-glucan-branching enzyme GBE1 [Gigaspora margarita]|uniref:1,4-alpha-glucan-branching enzyme GBE1 n=1 Tax=Gigaspora margarita TaxID=4874 RepID=A0A8H4EHI7_GIGMA|nr:1,4-alpha-glucan-branching enzyme GBE1 [Gigaspora margarita]